MYELTKKKQRKVHFLLQKIQKYDKTYCKIKLVLL